MKKRILSWIIFLAPLHLFSQLPDIDFTTFTPRWFQIIEDTNFIEGSNETLNSFNSVYPSFLPAVEDTFSYIVLNSNDGNANRDGCVLVKLRNDNGNILWSKFMNTSNGDDQNYNTSYFVDDTIYIAGRKRTKHSINLGEDWQIGGYSKPFYRKINKLTGAIEKEIYNHEDTTGISDGFIKKILLPFNSHLFSLSRMEEGVLISELKDNSHDINSEQFLPYPDPIPAESVYKTRALFIRENNEKCNIFYHSVSNDTLLHPHLGKLDYYQLKNNSFELEKTIDFSKYIKKVPVSGMRDRINYKFSHTGAFVVAQTYQEDQYPNFRN